VVTSPLVKVHATGRLLTLHPLSSDAVADNSQGLVVTARFNGETLGTDAVMVQPSPVWNTDLGEGWGMGVEE